MNRQYAKYRKFQASAVAFTMQFLDDAVSNWPARVPFSIRTGVPTCCLGAGERFADVFGPA